MTIAYRDIVDADAALALALRDPSGEWTIEHVEVGGNVGWDPAMAVDARGMIHLAYPSLNSSDDLRYARGRPGDWSIETVEQEGRVGQATAVAIDPSGAVHLAYHGYNSKGYGREVRYATNAGGGWRIESLGEGSLDESTRIAVDTLGRVHMVYLIWGTGLRHAVRTAQGWAAESIADKGVEGPWIDGFDMKLVFGALHVVYSSSTGLYYARLPLAVDQDCDGEDD